MNNIKTECDLPLLQSPTLVSLKSAPPVEQVPVMSRPRPLIRNCLSQESIRRRIEEPQEGALIRDGSGTVRLGSSQLGQKRSSFFPNNCQTPNIVYTSESELYAEKENCQEAFDFMMNKPFRIRTNSGGGKIKLEKVKNIKVISAIPEPDTSTNLPKQTPAFVKRGLSDKKTLRIDTKKVSLQLQLDEQKLILPIHPQSSHVKSSNMFMFPNSATTKAKGFSPLQPHNLEFVNRSNTPSSANIRRTPVFLNKCDDFEPMKGLKELRSPPGQDKENLVMRRFPSETSNYLNPLNDQEVVRSPIVRVRSNMCFKRSAFAAESTSGLLSPTGQIDQGLKIQRVNSKFKNEQAVLNRLFSSGSLNKKE